MSNPWPLVPLGEVLKERQEIPPSEAMASGEIPIVAKIGFGDGKIQLRSEGQTRTGMILIHPGDLVVSGINAAKGAIAIYSEENTKPIAATIHYGAYIPNKPRVDTKFLWWLLRSRTFRDLLFEYMPGGIKTELKAKRLLPIPVPLPSLPQQQMIVAQIEELSAKIADASALRHEATEEADVMINSALGHISDEISVDGVLGEVLTGPPRNGWSAQCDNDIDGTPVLTLSAVTGFRYRPSEFKRTSLPVARDGHFWLKHGDLLITRSNTPELVGHAAIYDGNPAPCIYPDLMMRLELAQDKVDRRFAWYWLQGPTARDFIRQKAKGTSPTMKKISQDIVMAIPFPSSLPVIEQRRIVAELDSLQAKMDALKRMQDGTTDELDALLPAILDRAFKGEL